jgi:hypothetical protein
MKFINKSQQFNKIIGSPAKRAMRAGKKEGGMGEGIFARPLILGGGWVCVAEGDAQVNQSFVQNRFALCPVIAIRRRPTRTGRRLTQTQRGWWARIR